MLLTTTEVRWTRNGRTVDVCCLAISLKWEAKSAHLSVAVTAYTGWKRTLRDGVHVVSAVAEAGDVVLDPYAAAQLLFHCRSQAQPSALLPTQAEAATYINRICSGTI